MRIVPPRLAWWLAVPIAIALGLAFAVAFDRAASPAQAQAGATGGGFTFSLQQLIINQRISQAAVRRSNRANERLDALEGAGGQRGGRQGEPGAQGPAGPAGPQGPAGEDLTFTTEKWGVIGRNTFGSPLTEFRVGPFGRTSPGDFAATQPPPEGDGSLGILVRASGLPNAEKEKLAFGNENDFAGMPLADIDEVSYWYFADMDQQSAPPGGGVGVRPPHVSIEINPNDGTHSYSSLNALVPQLAPGDMGHWREFDALADGEWSVTNSALATAIGCTGTCSFADITSALPGAEISYSVHFSKGRDNDFRGAVDALRINDDVYDFEPNGVHVRSAS